MVEIVHLDVSSVAASHRMSVTTDEFENILVCYLNTHSVTCYTQLTPPWYRARIEAFTANITDTTISVKQNIIPAEVHVSV